jgi:hypothetical protein
MPRWIKLKRKLLFLVLVIVLILAAYLYLRPAQAILSVDKVYNVDEVGSTVLVNVTLTKVSSCSGWQLNLTWDPYYLNVTQGQPPYRGGPPVEVREGPFFKTVNASTTMIFNQMDFGEGVMIVADFFAQGAGKFVNGTGVILTINFTVVNLGTSTIKLNPPSAGVTQSVIADQGNKILDHLEVNGLVTNDGPPPQWASTDFATTLLYGEVGVLGVASAIIYVYANPRPPKAEKKRAELEPVIDPEDQT